MDEVQYLLWKMDCWHLAPRAHHLAIERRSSWANSNLCLPRGNKQSQISRGSSAMAQKIATVILTIPEARSKAVRELLSAQ
jgi:hypothetical protein